MSKVSVFSLKMFAITAVAATMAGAQIPIADVFDLQRIGKEASHPMNGHYELTISFSAQGQQGSLQWEPIGTKDDPFRGTFDGKGHTISNLYISRAANAGHVGLFGYVGDGATIRNLTVATATALPAGVTAAVTGGYNVGILAGTNYGTITDCETRGTVSAARQQGNVGGLVGSNSGAVIRSFSNATVNGTENVGGLVGIVSGGSVRLSYAQGPVGNTNSKYAGGLIGYVFGGTVHQCYATGMTRGNEHVGGLIGYDFGSARAGWNTAGRSASGNVQKAEVSACFWDRTTTGQITSAGNMGEGRTTGDMTQRGTFTSAGWDFSEGVSGAWTISGGYPRVNMVRDIDGPGYDDLREWTLSYSVRSNGRLSCGNACEFTRRNGQMGPEVTATPDNGYRFIRWSDGNMARMRQDRATGNISVVAEFEVNDHPDIPGTAIRIHNYEELKKIGNDPAFPLDGHYAQMGDIDASPSRGENDGAGFEPIGTRVPHFTGRFDGRGYTISGLYINRPNASNVGLFGRTVAAHINGVNVVADTVVGGSQTGALVGYASVIYSNVVGSVTNSSARGIIHGNHSVGGLVGQINFGNVTNCYSAGLIVGTTKVGGLIGQVGGSTNSVTVVRRSYSTATVIGGREEVGGLIGESSGKTEQCFATGSVNGGSTLGGLIGRTRFVSLTTIGEVTNSYSSGRVTGSGSNIGGLVGRSEATSSITNSFWDITASNQPVRENEWGGTGLPTDQLMQRNTYENWDFVDIWAIDEGQSYPFLRSLGRPVVDHINQSSPPANHPVASLSKTPASSSLQVTVKSRTLSIATSSFGNQNLQIRVVDMRGKTVARFTTTAINSNFSLSNLSTGRYLVEIRDVNRNRVNVSPIMVR